jgi:hypothetical protein
MLGGGLQSHNFLLSLSIYIYFLLRPVALQSFLLAKANVPRPQGLISTKTIFQN